MKTNCIYCGKEFEYDESKDPILAMLARADGKSYTHIIQHICAHCCSDECKSKAVSEWFREVFV